MRERLITPLTNPSTALVVVASGAVVITASVVDHVLVGWSVVTPQWIVLAVAVSTSVCIFLMRGANHQLTAKLGGVFVGFAAGVVAGGGIRVHVGGHVKFFVAPFCNAVAPLLASLFLGIVFATVSTNRPGDQDLLVETKQLGLLYVVIGAICTAVGNVGDQTGWAIGCLYLVVSGSIGASAYVIIAVARSWNRTEANLSLSTSRDREGDGRHVR